LGVTEIGDSMNHKAEIHAHIQKCADVLLDHIRQAGATYPDRWVPAAEIKNALEINFVAVPKANTPRGEKGWFFATLARILEDQGRLEYERRGSRSYCRSTTP
jgi:hypothetical protein